jgi:hypothetical protein
MRFRISSISARDASAVRGGPFPAILAPAFHASRAYYVSGAYSPDGPTGTLHAIKIVDRGPARIGRPQGGGRNPQSGRSRLGRHVDGEGLSDDEARKVCANAEPPGRALRDGGTASRVLHPCPGSVGAGIIAM